MDDLRLFFVRQYDRIDRTTDSTIVRHAERQRAHRRTRLGDIYDEMEAEQRIHGHARGPRRPSLDSYDTRRGR